MANPNNPFGAFDPQGMFDPERIAAAMRGSRNSITIAVEPAFV